MLVAQIGVDVVSCFYCNYNFGARNTLVLTLISMLQRFYREYIPASTFQCEVYKFLCLFVIGN